MCQVENFSMTLWESVSNMVELHIDVPKKVSNFKYMKNQIRWEARVASKVRERENMA